jgi:hypothetical protein
VEGFHAPDRLELRVDDPGVDIPSRTPHFASSRDAGGDSDRALRFSAFLAE